MRINPLAPRTWRFLASIMMLAGGGASAAILSGSTGDAVVSNDVMNFHFDEGARATVFNDLSAANQAAFCSGRACPTAGAIGLRGTPKHNNARLTLDFDGVDDCLRIADNSAHEMSLPLFMSVWILPRRLPVRDGSMAILSKYRASGNQREWILGIRTDAAGISRLAFWQSTTGNSATTTAVYSRRQLTSPADLNRWMHVVIRITAGRQYEWWVNGSFESRGTVADNRLFKGRASVRIGCVDYSRVSPDFLFRGKIDEILVAKSVVANADIRRLYDWSRPVQPTMAYVAGAPLRPESCRVDEGVLAARLTDLGPNVYRFWIRPNKRCRSPCDYPSSKCTCAGSCNDFSALRTFLAQNPGIKVIVEKNPFWYSIDPSGASATCLSKKSPEQVWGCAIGELARTYPNLVGWSLDDFFAEKSDGGGIVRSFLTRSLAKAACAAVHDPVSGAPDVNVYATVYCNDTVSNRIRRKYNMYAWLHNQPAPTWEHVFVDYVNSDPELRACITGVSLYTSPDRLTAGSATINRCIGTLQTLQVEQPILDIVEGVYISGLSEQQNNCAQRRRNVGYSRRTTPDGFAFYEMPVPSDASCPGYGWLKQQTIPPTAYIQW
jgi:hypothetical protein